MQWLGGRKQTQMQEPLDHALGRSRGGFTTKIHLVCDKRGCIVALHFMAGQEHESKAFEPTMARRLIHRRRGEGRWPNHLAGDKGSSYSRIPLWCLWRRIEAVIPTRKDQPRDEHFDKSLYRQRNIIERVVGWFEENRALGTRACCQLPGSVAHRHDRSNSETSVSQQPLARVVCARPIFEQSLVSACPLADRLRMASSNS